jgi:SAM-dependent methyltransferase
MQHDDLERAVSEDYGRPELLEAITEALRAAGKDPAQVTPADLAPFDQFHTGGKEATLGLLKLADLPQGCIILDIGGGYGGPARTLAELLDAQVTVLDVTEEFCRVGAILTEWTGLSARVRFEHGSALAMPFADESFDAGWMQNVTMNIHDKPRLFREIHRVLRPGARLAMQNWVAGPVQPLHFPVSWASEASLSYLLPPDEMRALLAEAGFREVAWEVRPISSAPISPAGRIVHGERAEEIAQNNQRNITEGRILFTWTVAERV